MGRPLHAGGPARPLIPRGDECSIFSLADGDWTMEEGDDGSVIPAFSRDLSLVLNVSTPPKLMRSNRIDCHGASTCFSGGRWQNGVATGILRKFTERTRGFIESARVGSMRSITSNNPSTSKAFS